MISCISLSPSLPDSVFIHVGHAGQPPEALLRLISFYCLHMKRASTIFAKLPSHRRRTRKGAPRLNCLLTV
jgi:hypothetical protein